MATNSKTTSRAAAIEDDDDIIPIDLRRVVITLFVICQLTATALWLLPQSWTQVWALRPLQHYMWWTGCDQNWNMFAPQPASTDVYLSADITYQSGAHKSWDFPRMHDLDYFRRYQEERFRKMIEFAHQDNYSRMWWPLAHFAALANNAHPTTDPVVHVELVRHWQPIPSPGTPLPPYSVYTFYRADFAPGSLSQ
ncbi:MAG TPA: hypothetical protein VFW40_11670 [Capsulimonadaceae bacterium]|nr:hypothetical protein [Capsulimonadaceae bacterium]